MRFRLILCTVFILGFALLAAASGKTADSKDESKPVASSENAQHAKDLRLEGEKRYHANCSRCHAAPPKFPPRMMGTIVRHMRVRAMLTDEDMHLILRYMTK
jgi:cytochrome c5